MVRAVSGFESLEKSRYRRTNKGRKAVEEKCDDSQTSQNPSTPYEVFEVIAAL